MSLGLFVCFVILLQYGSGEPQSCYFCNTEVHGEGCNDPIVTDRIQIQTCSTMETVQEGSTFSKILNFFTHNDSNEATLAENVSIRNTYPNVCYNMTYVYNEKIVSSRGCESQTRDGSFGGTYEICEYYSQLYPTNRVSNFSCNVCTDNLCNHANYVPSSSTNVVISIKLIGVLLVSKLYFM